MKLENYFKKKHYVICRNNIDCVKAIPKLEYAILQQYNMSLNFDAVDICLVIHIISNQQVHTTFVLVGWQWQTESIEDLLQRLKDVERE